MNSENRKIPNNELSASFHHSKNKKKDASSSDVRNIKTMFAQMKNASTSSADSVVTTQQSSTKKEKKNMKQNKMNSFFSKKLEIITSPIKTEVNDKLSTEVLSPSENSEEYSSKKLDNTTPTKNVENENVEKISMPLTSFFSRKLEIVSPSKQTDPDPLPLSITSSIGSEESVEEAPIMLLCERCNKTIDIDQYDEHIDHHVAMELSKSLNTTDITQPLGSTIHKTGSSVKKKKNEFSKKRKNNNNASSSSPKKQCTSISSYFKPVLNP